MSSCASYASAQAPFCTSRGGQGRGGMRGSTRRSGVTGGSPAAAAQLKQWGTQACISLVLESFKNSKIFGFGGAQFERQQEKQNVVLTADACPTNLEPPGGAACAPLNGDQIGRRRLQVIERGGTVLGGAGVFSRWQSNFIPLGHIPLARTTLR